MRANFSLSVSNLIGTDHRIEYFDNKKMLETLPEVWGNMDEPFFRCLTLLPTFFLSKLTKKKLSVVLSGDGGDEVLQVIQPI